VGILSKLAIQALKTVKVTGELDASGVPKVSIEARPFSGFLKI